MRVSRALILFAAMGTSLVCAQIQNYCYPHDPKNTESARVYLLDDSGDCSVTILADKLVIWNGVVPKTGKSPNIHVAGIPPMQQKKCKIRVIGGPYRATQDVDWRRGKALVVHFLEKGVSLAQHQLPVGFQ